MDAILTTYTVTASSERDGQVIDCSQAEVLGEAYGKIYTDRDEAQAAVNAIAEAVAADDCELDPTTAGSINEQTYEVVSIDYRDDYTAGDHGDVEVPEYQRYIGVRIKVGGTGHQLHTWDVAVQIGLHESEWGSAKASGAGVTLGNCPHAFWSDLTDHQEVPAFAKDWILERLNDAAKCLWRAATDAD